MSVRPTKQMLQRSIIVMLIVILCFTTVSSYRLIKIMIVKGDEYQNLASEQQLYDSLITAPRGNIYDSNMNLLATSAPAWTVYLTPNGINKISDTAKAETIRSTIARGLSEILEMDYEKVYECTKKTTYYVIVKKKIEQDTVDKIRQLF